MHSAMYTGLNDGLKLCKYGLEWHIRFLVLSVQDYYDAMPQLTLAKYAAKMSKQINVYEVCNNS